MELKLGKWKLTVYHRNFRLYRDGWMIVCLTDRMKLWIEFALPWRWGKLSGLVRGIYRLKCKMRGG